MNTSEQSKISKTYKWKNAVFQITDFKNGQYQTKLISGNWEYTAFSPTSTIDNDMVEVNQQIEYNYF